MKLDTLKYSGIVGGVIYWLFTFWAISRNKWFSFFEHALSDLGTAEANAPWIYNCGLMISSIFGMLFAVYLVLTSKTKLQTVGGAYISVATLFLALIGIYPGGTRPHVFVSAYFLFSSFLECSSMVWEVRRDLGTFHYSFLCLQLLEFSLLGPL